MPEIVILTYYPHHSVLSPSTHAHKSHHTPFRLPYTSINPSHFIPGKKNILEKEISGLGPIFIKVNFEP
jgi:hypothetical protein